MSSVKTAALDALFNPRSVAIIGASAVAGKQGAAALRYLRQGGFPGAIYPVNPAGGEIDGLTCDARVSDIPGPVDCVLTVIPAAATAASPGGQGVHSPAVNAASAASAAASLAASDVI